MRLIVHYRARDIGYGIEEGTVVLPAVDDYDWTGKRAYRSLDGSLVYLFDDELETREVME